MDKKAYKRWFLGLICGDLYKKDLKHFLMIGQKDEEQFDLIKNAMDYSPAFIELTAVEKKQRKRLVNLYNFKKFNKENKKILPKEIDVIYFDSDKINSTFLINCENLMHDLSLLFIKSTKSLESMIKIVQKKGELVVIKSIKVFIEGKVYNLFVLSKNFDMIEQSEYRIENLLDFEKNELL